MPFSLSLSLSIDHVIGGVCASRCHSSRGDLCLSTTLPPAGTRPTRVLLHALHVMSWRIVCFVSVFQVPRYQAHWLKYMGTFAFKTRKKTTTQALMKYASTGSSPYRQRTVVTVFILINVMLISFCSRGAVAAGNADRTNYAWQRCGVNKGQ